MPRILVAWSGNSCRSQMAEAILRSIEPTLDVHSAGTSPAPAAHPKALQVLGEIGIRHRYGRPNRVDEFLSRAFDSVVTVCDHAKETCPAVLGTVRKQLHIGFDGPASADGTEEEILKEFHRVRDGIHREFTAFCHKELTRKGGRRMSTSRTIPVVLLGLLLVFPLRAPAQEPPTALQLKRFVQEATVSTLTPDGSLVDKSGQFAADSGSLSVPEDRFNPHSRHILIPVVRILATGASPSEPVFHLSGGPGQSNMHSFSFDYFIDRHDHIMVGYRGVDGEISLDCPEVTEAIKASGDILSSDALERVRQAFARCSERVRSAGVKVDCYTVVDVADDLESARRALGYESIAIVAESYGTRLALVYAMKYPQAITRMILIGTNPPGHMVWDPHQSDSLLMRYAELWNADSAASARCPDLIEAITRVNRTMPDRWLVFPIRPGTVKASFFSFLFHRETAAQAFDAYVAAADGDPSGLWLISAASAYIYPDIVNWGDNASKAVSADFEEGRDYLHELMPEEAILGAPLGSFLWAPAQQGAWPITMIPEEYRSPRPSNVQTLFVSGSLDFSTPADNVERELLPLFPNGRHVVLREMGHVGDVWSTNPALAKKILVTFLDHGIAADGPFAVTPMRFEVGMGFPTLAKLIVGGAVALVLLLAGSAVLVIRRLRRKSRTV